MFSVPGTTGKRKVSCEENRLLISSAFRDEEIKWPGCAGVRLEEESDCGLGPKF